MTDRPAVLVDRGYRRTDVERLGRRGARAAIVREGLRRVLGLRRKARRKIFPWAIVALTVTSVVVLIGLHWVASSAVSPDALELPRYGEYFDMISRLALLFIALAAPQLLVPDRRQGVLSVYFSRPLKVGDYLGAKVAALSVLVLAFYLVPQTVLHLGLAALSPNGFFGYLGANLDVLWQIPAAAFVYLVAHASISFLLGAYLPRVGAAAAAFLGVLLVLNGVSGALVEAADVPLGGLLALEQHPRVVRDWIFDIQTVEYFPALAGFEPWMSLVVTVATAVAAGALIFERYRRLR